MHLLRFSACCWCLLGHDPGSHTCAIVGTLVSKIHDFRSTQTSTHLATCVWSQWYLVMNVLIMPLHLGLEAKPQATMLPLVGSTKTLMLLRVLMAVTALMRSGNGYSAFERTGHCTASFTSWDSALCSPSGSPCFLVHFT